MRRFILYRHRVPDKYVAEGYGNQGDEIQLEGVEFTDGTVCVRWRTELKSHSIWTDFETFNRVHGHPEYDSELVWLDD